MESLIIGTIPELFWSLVDPVGLVREEVLAVQGRMVAARAHVQRVGLPILVGDEPPVLEPREGDPLTLRPILDALVLADLLVRLDVDDGPGVGLGVLAQEVGESGLPLADEADAHALLLL